MPQYISNLRILFIGHHGPSSSIFRVVLARSLAIVRTAHFQNGVSTLATTDPPWRPKLPATKFRPLVDTPSFFGVGWHLKTLRTKEESKSQTMSWP